MKRSSRSRVLACVMWSSTPPRMIRRKTGVSVFWNTNLIRRRHWPNAVWDLAVSKFGDVTLSWTGQIHRMNQMKPPWPRWRFSTSEISLKSVLRTCYVRNSKNLAELIRSKKLRTTHSYTLTIEIKHLK